MKMKKSLKLLKKVLREPAVIVLAEDKKTTITNVCAKNSENRSKTPNLKVFATVCFIINRYETVENQFTLLRSDNRQNV